MFWPENVNAKLKWYWQGKKECQSRSITIYHHYTETSQYPSVLSFDSHNGGLYMYYDTDMYMYSDTKFYVVDLFCLNC